MGKIKAFSAGSSPAKEINPVARLVMEEKGLVIKNRKPKNIADFIDSTFDLAVTMGCETTCPVVNASKIIVWSITDPKGKPVEDVRLIRDEIEKKVQELLAKLFN